MTNIEIIAAKFQTKDWRKEQEWYIDGKRNECEKYQRNTIENITGQVVVETNMRFNTETGEFTTNTCPMKNEDGFEWTEDMDGYQKLNDTEVYYNLKMVCMSGGAQTRTLREVYHLIKCQLNYLKNTKEKIVFVNILDGDISHKHIDKYNYLLNKEKYCDIKDKVYCGDLHGFVNNYLPTLQ